MRGPGRGDTEIYQRQTALARACRAQVGQQIGELIEEIATTDEQGARVRVAALLEDWLVKSTHKDRAQVGEQLAQLIVEGDRMGSRSELGPRLQRIILVERQLEEARGRVMQAKRIGNPYGAFLEQEIEALELLRQAVMSLGASCGAWVAAMDFEAQQRFDIVPELNGTDPEL